MSSSLELLSAAGLRNDNRRPAELRHLDFTIHPLPPLGADSAASVRHGQTRLFGFLSGPKHSSSSQASSQLSVCVSNLPFGSIERKNRSSAAPSHRSHHDKSLLDLELFLRDSFTAVILLDLYPRSTIEISIEVVEQDGSLLQAAVNLTTLLLIGAGVSISDSVLSISLGYIHDHLPLIDLSLAEETDLANSLTMSYLPRTAKVGLIDLNHCRIDPPELEQLLIIGTQACQALVHVLDSEVKRWAALIHPSAAIASTFPAVELDRFHQQTLNDSDPPGDEDVLMV